jgi:hypothetical protein
MTHPKNWYILVTEENRKELQPWWQEQVRKSGWGTGILRKDRILLSEHPSDSSYYWSGNLEHLTAWYPSYQEITLEQFRQITNSQPMTHPKHWCIEATNENFSELYAWWKKSVGDSYNGFRVGRTLMSQHPKDESQYYAGDIKHCIADYPQFVEITLEQFRKITNSQPMKHPEYWPEHWCIEATRENFSELKAWREENADIDFDFQVGYTLMSEHPKDESKYYAGDIKECIDIYPQFVEITLEQFREITNFNYTQTTMTKSIQISRELLNEYYNAATIPQKEYLTEHFKLDGTTTVEAIRGLHDIACGIWKPRIKKNHPDCFPEDSKHFDFSERMNRFIISRDVCKSLGLEEDFIQVRNSGNQELAKRSFYLSPTYNWELVQDDNRMALIPTKK